MRPDPGYCTETCVRSHSLVFVHAHKDTTTRHAQGTDTAENQDMYSVIYSVPYPFYFSRTSTKSCKTKNVRRNGAVKPYVLKPYRTYAVRYTLHTTSGDLVFRAKSRNR